MRGTLPILLTAWVGRFACSGAGARSANAVTLSCYLVLAGCIASNQTGPFRPFSIADDVQAVQHLGEPDWPYYYSLSPEGQAVYRNNIVTARMYIADLNYHYYETNLTKEMQNEGLLATAVNLALTGSAALIPVAQTDRLLAGIATGVTGLDKAYNEKELLSNTIQHLQTQMRADRKAQSAAIFSKMLKDIGNNTKTVTPIAEYTLPMALSDTDAYYQAGTVASALVGLSRTVANADQNADDAKAKAGPNPLAVASAKDTAAPRSSTVPPNSSVRVVRITSPFVSDTATVALTRFLSPNGVRDSDHAKIITDFLAEKRRNVSITFFLNSSIYAAERAELARRLNLVP